MLAARSPSAMRAQARFVLTFQMEYTAALKRSNHASDVFDSACGGSVNAHCTGTGILSDTAQRELNNELCIQESCAFFSRSSQPGSVATAFAMFRELRRCIGETVYMSPEPHGLQRSMGGEGRPGNGGVTYRYRWRSMTRMGPIMNRMGCR